MTRDELQRLYDECTRAENGRVYRTDQITGLVEALGRFLAEPDPTVEIAYLKAKVADLSDEYHTHDGPKDGDRP